MIAGTDCGYGTWVGQAAVDPDVVWAKMAAMAEGARIATKKVLVRGFLEMKRSENRIPHDHVGSIIRPPELLEAARAARANGGEHATKYDALLKVKVAEVVRQQAAAGIDIVNDGEYGKSSWAAYVLERMTGFERRMHQLRLRTGWDATS